MRSQFPRHSHFTYDGCSKCNVSIADAKPVPSPQFLIGIIAHLTLCFNRRCEASSLATMALPRSVFLYCLFQSQMRSQFPRHAACRAACSSAMSVSIADAKPVPSPHVYEDEEHTVMFRFNRRCEASSLATASASQRSCGGCATGFARQRQFFAR